MTQTRLTDALARVVNYQELRLPLRRSDVLGRLAIKFLWRRHLKWQIESNLAVRDSLESITQQLHAQSEALQSVAGQPEVDELRQHVESLRASDQNLIAGLNQRLYSAMGRMQSELADLRMQVADTAAHAEASDKRLAELEAKTNSLGTAERDTRLRHAQMSLLLDELKSARSECRETHVDTVVPDRIDQLELAVSELLDGPSEHIRESRQSYIRLLLELQDNGPNGPVFDMAPARGEWLELLREADIAWRSSSRNSLIRKRCRELGLAVADSCPLDALSQTANRSLRAITAFRYVERQQPNDLGRFVDLAVETLQPGGALIVETPMVSSNTLEEFYLDPLARQPVHPEYFRFLAEAAGFASVEVRAPEPAGGISNNLYSLVAWR